MPLSAVSSGGVENARGGDEIWLKLIRWFTDRLARRTPRATEAVRNRSRGGSQASRDRARRTM